jgi:hypothetical protein
MALLLVTTSMLLSGCSLMAGSRVQKGTGSDEVIEILGKPSIKVPKGPGQLWIYNQLPVAKIADAFGRGALEGRPNAEKDPGAAYKLIIFFGPDQTVRDYRVTQTDFLPQIR